MSRSPILRTVAVLAVATVGVAGCGSSKKASSSASTAAAATSAATSAASGTLVVSNAWSRTSAAAQDVGVVYLTVENSGDKADALTAASVPATVAMSVQLHETVTGGAMAGSSTTAVAGSTTAMGSATTTVGSSMPAGQMSMQPVDKIDVPAKGMVELKPGGFHIMLMGLKQPLVKGTSIDVTLTFASGASKTVKAEVRDA
jgi:copper(I)-binding protein